MDKNNKLQNYSIYIFLMILSLISIYPFLWMISSMFKEMDEIFTLPPTFIPKKFTLHNFPIIFSEKIPFITWFINSTIVVSIRLLLSLFFCSLAGFAFAQYEFPFKKILLIIVISSIMIPWQALLVPLYVMMIKINWVNTYFALWVPWMASPFGIFLMRQYMLSLPIETIEAARTDGASEFRIYWQIAIPLSRPGLAALGIILFLEQWTNFLWPLIILNSPDKFTLPIGLAQILSQLYSHGVIEWGGVMIMSALTTLPILIIFLTMQRHFASGLMFGSVK